MGQGFRHAGAQAADPRERVVRWGVLVLALALGFGPVHVPYGVVLVLPALAWTALRAPLREVASAVLVVAVVAAAVTWWGRGPFSAARLDSSIAGARWWACGLFVGVCAIVAGVLTASAGRGRAALLRSDHAQRWSDAVVGGVGAVAVLSLDADGVIQEFSPGAQRVLGYTRAEVVGRTLRMFQSDDEVVRLAEQLGCPPRHDAILAALSDRNDVAGAGATDVEVIGKDDQPRTLSLMIREVRAEDGTLLGRVVTAGDATERARAQASLDDVVRMEREARERLTDIERAKETFVSSVSHELRTPITNIVGYLEMLGDGMYGPVSGEQSAALERIGQNSKRLLTLIDDLLTMSSVEDLGVALANEEMDLREVVQRSQEMFRPALHGRELKLDVVLPDEPVVVTGDPDHLERLVTNLVRNAIKFTPDGGSISVYLRGRSPWWCLEVADTGMGIPAEDLPMVFNRFHRASNSEGAAIQGSGLGLSIALKIAERHRAQITVDSAVGYGSTFRVESLDAPPPR